MALTIFYSVHYPYPFVKREIPIRIALLRHPRGKTPYPWQSCKSSVVATDIYFSRADLRKALFGRCAEMPKVSLACLVTARTITTQIHPRDSQRMITDERHERTHRARSFRRTTMKMERGDVPVRDDRRRRERPKKDE